MQKKLTISIDETVYYRLHSIIGEQKISKFIESLVKPHLINEQLAVAYHDIAKDSLREQEAQEWIEGLSREEKELEKQNLIKAYKQAEQDEERQELLKEWESIEDDKAYRDL